MNSTASSLLKWERLFLFDPRVYRTSWVLCFRSYAQCIYCVYTHSLRNDQWMCVKIIFVNIIEDALKLDFLCHKENSNTYILSHLTDRYVSLYCMYNVTVCLFVIRISSFMCLCTKYTENAEEGLVTDKPVVSRHLFTVGFNTFRHACEYT